MNVLTAQNAPLGTKAPAIMGGAWCKTDRGWKWNGPDGEGGTFPTPGGDWTGAFVLPPTPIFWRAEWRGPFNHPHCQAIEAHSESEAIRRAELYAVQHDKPIVHGSLTVTPYDVAQTDTQRLDLLIKNEWQFFEVNGRYHIRHSENGEMCPIDGSYRTDASRDARQALDAIAAQYPAPIDDQEQSENEEISSRYER